MSARSLAVLFVCLGNICRSPTAQGVMVHRLQAEGLSARVRLDSAGTAGYHIGKAPDSRTLKAAAGRGFDLTGFRARQVSVSDFQQFDYILAMDASNLQALKALQPENSRARLGLFLSYAGDGYPGDVPDPYYGGPEGFDTVLDLVEAAADGLLAELRQRLES